MVSFFDRNACLQSTVIGGSVNTCTVSPFMLAESGLNWWNPTVKSRLRNDISVKNQQQSGRFAMNIWRDGHIWSVILLLAWIFFGFITPPSILLYIWARSSYDTCCEWETLWDILGHWVTAGLNPGFNPGSSSTILIWKDMIYPIAVLLVPPPLVVKTTQLPQSSAPPWNQFLFVIFIDYANEPAIIHRIHPYKCSKLN